MILYAKATVNIPVHSRFESEDLYPSNTLGVHIVIQRHIGDLHQLSASQFAGPGGGGVVYGTGDVEMVHAMLFCQTKQEQTGLRCIVMAPVCLVNMVADVAAQICLLGVTDAQIASPDGNAVRQADGEVVSRDSALIRLRLVGSVQPERDSSE